MMLFITITSLFARIFVLLQNMNIEKLYRKEIDDLLQKRSSTVFHITGIRHCDYKKTADAFIVEAAKTMLSASLFPEMTNQYDSEAVSCRRGRKKIGYVATYDLEKYTILAKKNDDDHLTGHFGHFSANIEDHLLKLYIPGVITLDEISEHRKNIDEQKDALYGSWKHDAIDHYLVHSDQQEEAIACISQLKEHVVQLFGGHSTSTREELTPILDDYKDCSQYDISLEGQQNRWDILLYLDLIHDHNHQPGQCRDEFYEGLLKDVEDVISQIAGELVRSVSYKSYIERLKELVTKHIPSSEAARHYLNTLPPNAFDDIRQQVESFPLNLYYLFHTNPEEFVRTIYYARIPRKYLDPFLSGIALVEAYDKNKKVDISIETPVSPQMKEDPKKQLTREEILDKLMGYASKGNWVKGIKVEDITSMLKTVLDTSKLIDQEHVNMSKILWDRLEHGRDGKSNRVDIVWANIVGYLKTKGFFSTINAAELSMDFFENKDQGGNINKGSYHQLDKVKSLLDAYLPKLPSKK